MKNNNNFTEEYSRRVKELRNDLPNLTVEEVRYRYKKLWDGCPIELHIDDFSLINEIESKFPDFHIEGITKKTYNIPVNEIPQINLKLESREVQGKVVHVPWKIIETPYMILSDRNGTRRVWIKSKKKIILYYLHKITRIEWFINQYLKKDE
jgi:hypothetical protein